MTVSRVPPIDFTDAVVVALIAFASGLVGHLTNRRSSREQTMLTVMQAQITDLWERVQQQEKRIDDLVADRHHERSRAWAAIEYARVLIAYSDALIRLLPDGAEAPPAPAVPEELSADL